MTLQHAGCGCATSLADLPCGCKFQVEDLTGSPAQRSKLYAMGIIPGTEVEVAHTGEGKGSVCVRVKQSCLVLGESLARSIFCTPLAENELHTQRCRKHGKSLMRWCKKHWSGQARGNGRSAHR